MKKIFVFISVSLVVGSCTKTQFGPNTASTGGLDFTHFISVGNSLTQGYMDGGLYAYGQSNSYPSIIAAQVSLASSITYLQPNVTGNGSGYIHLVDVNGQLTPIQSGDSTYGPPVNPDPTWNTWGTSYQSQKMNNLGVSGITLNAAVGLNFLERGVNFEFCSQNPYGRFLNFGSFGSPIQYIDYIRSSGATFFTCWLGSNDVLGYATNGGKVNYFDGFALNGITPANEFAQKYDSILTAFHKLGAKGICATIPDVTSIPYFNTVPSYVTINGNSQYLYISTKSGIRLATMQDHILLTAYTTVLAGGGLTKATALPDSLVLDATEVDSVETAITQFNASIKSTAASFGYAVVDMYQYLSTLQTSVYIDGISFSRQFIQGGAFGLDGIHPNARGYAMVANEFISTINNFYGSNIPPADMTKFKGVLFP